jgi:pimeloyl-ACP methyl ester carboxylesterase
VTVVAHSYGGMVVAEAAHGLDHVERLLFVGSFLPLPGESLSAIGGDGPPPWMDIDLAAGTFALRPEFAAGTYLQDCPDDVVGPAVERLVPQTVSVSAAPVTFAAWQGIPSTYLVCAGDLGTPPALQRQQAERAARVAQSRGSLDSKWCPPTRLGPSFGGVAPHVRVRCLSSTGRRSPGPHRVRRLVLVEPRRQGRCGWRPSASRGHRHLARRRRGLLLRLGGDRLPQPRHALACRLRTGAALRWVLVAVRGQRPASDYW